MKTENLTPAEQEINSEHQKLTELFASVSPRQVIEDFENKVNPEYAGSEWAEVNRYYSDMQPCPYSMRDMEEKPFMGDLCKMPEE